MAGGTAMQGPAARDQVARYVLAVAAPTALALMFSRLPSADYRVGTGFVAVVVGVAVFAGVGPAIVSTLVALVGLWATVLPHGTGNARVWPDVVSLTVLAGSCAAAVVLSGQRDRVAAAKLAADRRYRRLADAHIVGILFWQLDGPITDANDTFLEMIGTDRDALDAGTIDWKRLTPPEYEEVDARKVAELVADGFHTPYEKEYLRTDGTRVAVVVGSAFLDGSDREGISFVLDVTARRQLEAEREASLAAERAARAELDAASRRLELLVHASASLLAASDEADIVERLASAAVPELADTATVLVREGHYLRRVGARSVTHPEVVGALGHRFAVSVSADSAIAAAWRTAEAQEIRSITPEALRATVPDDEYVTLITALDAREALALPMRAAGEVVGVLVLGGVEGRGMPSATSRLTAQELADRAAEALVGAQTHAAERRISRLLQRALLPEQVPAIAGHELAACYRPASVGRTIGGDWWDVLPMDGGRYAIVVGDIGGHGVQVASTMAELRHALRGLLLRLGSPQEATCAVNELLMRSNPGTFATAFVAVYEPSARRLTYCRSGHPPPVVLSDDGVLTLDAFGGTLLGLADVSREEHVVTLPDAFELLAFTDGLVESPQRTYEDGVLRLVEVAKTLERQPSPQLHAQRLVDQLVGGETRDDTLLLVLRSVPHGGERGPVRRDERTFTLDADEIAHARRFVFEVVGQDAELLPAVELAVSELTTNAMLHARTPFRLAVTRTPDCVRVEVHDGDPRLPRRKDYGPRAVTGRGLAIMDALCDAWGADPTPGGKCVWFEVSRREPR